MPKLKFDQLANSLDLENIRGKALQREPIRHREKFHIENFDHNFPLKHYFSNPSGSFISFYLLHYKFLNHFGKGLLQKLVVLNYFSSLSEIDTNKIATIGISLGGFRAMYLAGIEPKIKATTLVVTGESLSESISRSRLALAHRLRILHMGSIQTNYIEGPLKDLKTNWLFESIDKNKTKIKFVVDFEFKSFFHQKIAETLYPLIEKKMIESFRLRADEVLN